MTDGSAAAVWTAKGAAVTPRERLTWAHEPAMACGSDRPCSNCESRIEGARIALELALVEFDVPEEYPNRVIRNRIRALLSELEGRP